MKLVLNLKELNEDKNCLKNKGKVYNLQVGEMEVQVIYSEDSRTLNDCLINILKQKKGENA